MEGGKTLILWIIFFSLLGSVGAILTAAIFLSIQEKRQKNLIPCLISYATGTLLTAALLGLIPHALHHTTSSTVLSSVLVGILLFFLLEKMLVWRHCHDVECEIHRAAGSMLLIGDAFHNLTDGVVIAASFLSSTPIGIAASLSVLVHEIPQEIGDFAILLANGYSTRKALLWNTFSSLSTIPGAVLAYYALGVVHAAIPYAMAISAASFIYISLADLTPQLHSNVGFRYSLRQFLLLLAGVVTIVLFLRFHP
jgi:zinc and cadmium transporter